MLISIAQAAEPTVETATVTGQNSGLLAMMFSSSVFIQFTILILLLMSVFCWAIIGQKSRSLKRNQRKDKKFFTEFLNAENIDELIEEHKFSKSPAFNIFKNTIEAVRKVKKSKNSIEQVEREIRRSTDDEVELMEENIPFLATTSTIAPFIGLLGTVWGILYVFWKIGKTGVSSLTVVGPHIAEALITTVFGLCAAIPAVFFYNRFINKIRIQAKDLNDFSEDLLNRVEKEYFS